MKSLVLGIAVAGLLLSACSYRVTAASVIVTDGMHTQLPAPGTRAMFPALSFGSRASDYDTTGEGLARDAIVEWLHKHGVIFVVPVSDRARLLDEQRFRLQHDETDPLRIGKMQGASLIVDVRIASGYRDPSVTITATAVETGEIAWSGSARMAPRRIVEYHTTSLGGSVPTYATAQKLDAQTLSIMVCHALATAFGIHSPATYHVRLDQPCG